MGVPRRRLCFLVVVALAISAGAAVRGQAAAQAAQAAQAAEGVQAVQGAQGAAPPAGRPFCGGNDSVFFAVPRGDRIVSQRDARVCIEGSVTVRFHGSRGAGCAAHGLCDYAGTEVWQPGGGDLTLAVVQRRGHRAVETVYAADDAHPAAQVTRVVGGRVHGTCRDRGYTGDLEARLQPVHAGQVSFRPARAGVDRFPSRCAGPVDADLPMMPATQLPLAAVMRGQGETRVVAQRRFARGGFAGTIGEHLSITIARPGLPFSGGHAPQGGPAMRIVTVSYRIAASTGSIAVSWSHPPAGCALLDACELRGTERVGLGSSVRRSRKLTLVAEGPADRPERDFWAALGLSSTGNPLGIDVVGAQLGGTVLGIRDATAQAGAVCRETADAQGSVLADAAAGHLTFWLNPSELGPLFDGGGDPLRTSCPGPGLGAHPLASLRLPPGALAAGTTALAFTRPIGFHDHGYQVRLTPHLTVRLTRTRIRARVVGDRTGARSLWADRTLDKAAVCGLVDGTLTAYTAPASR